ncbi:hypothetical protein [Limnohabitans sp.]|jgi:hypothetical protein
MQTDAQKGKARAVQEKTRSVSAAGGLGPGRLHRQLGCQGEA